MTKYILNSGGAKNYPEKNKLFNDEILKGVGDKPNILFCFFARAREDWEIKFEDYKNNFSKMIDSNIKPEFELAYPDKFVEQVRDNDIIILQGGDDYLIKSWLEQYDLPKIWEGKIIVASSAGSNVLVNSFWTCDWRGCMDGLSILSVKFISHYRSEYGKDDPRGLIDWDKAYQELADYGDKSLPIHALEEGDFIVIEQ